MSPSGLHRDRVPHRTIVVTGGSRGIGAATARLAGGRGYNVVVGYHTDRQAALSTVAAVEEAGGRALPVAVDIASEADVVRLFQEAVDAFGPFCGVVNNAGMVSLSGRFLDYDYPRLQRIFAVNGVGALLVAREAARRMARSRGGSGGVIVNVSSAAARLGAPNEFIDYAATKGAMDAMTIGLSKELASEGIRVNAVRPGLIETDIHSAAGDPGRIARLVSGVPMGRGGTAEEVGEAILWLLSDAASYVNGAFIDVTGGR